MLETSRVCLAVVSVRRGAAAALVAGFALAGCVAPEIAPESAATAVAPVAKPQSAPVDPSALDHEARAMLAQAETDIQRARAKRALWSKAWESLVLARQAAATKDNAATVRHAKKASELAQLGLEQLAYPAVN